MPSSRQDRWKGKPDKETYFRESPMMHCAKCEETLHRDYFDTEMQDHWINVKGDAPDSVCKKCVRGHANEKRVEIEFLICDYCDRADGVGNKWPARAFLEEDLTEWRLHQTPLKCAACRLEAAAPEGPLPEPATLAIEKYLCEDHRMASALTYFAIT